jgi:hypothetical protein
MLMARSGASLSQIPPSQVEVQALRDKFDELADDVRALSATVHALPGRTAKTGVQGSSFATEHR